MKQTLNVNETNFDQEVVQSKQLVIVDFWAEWCGPCKMLAPILDEIARERPDVKVVKVDTAENPGLANRYGVRGIPTLLFIKDGEVKDTIIGLQSKKALLSRVDRLRETLITAQNS